MFKYKILVSISSEMDFFYIERILDKYLLNINRNTFSILTTSYSGDCNIIKYALERGFDVSTFDYTQNSYYGKQHKSLPNVVAFVGIETLKTTKRFESLKREVRNRNLKPQSCVVEKTAMY